MSMQEENLRPEDFAEAAVAAIEDAQGQGMREAALVLAQAGLTGVCVPEAHGGLGLGIAFAVPLAHAAGKLRLQFPLIEQVLLAKALAGTAYGEQLASGNKLATMALQGELSHGLVGAARHAQHGDWVLVFDGDGAVLMDMAGVAMAPDTSLDPDYPQHWLSVADAPVLARLDAATCKVLWHEARILLSAMVNGAADGALEATVGYMSTRVQFGRPLSANQAVRHALARMKLLQEASAAAIQRVLLTNEYGQARDAQSTLAGSIAHAVWVLEKAIHLHGGMGFTWDVPLHYALREVRKLDAALGAGTLVRDLGREWIKVA